MRTQSKAVTLPNGERFKATPLTLRVVPLSQLHVNPLQPSNRASSAAIAEMLDKVAKERFIAPPIVVKRPRPRSGYIVEDGQRRIEVARRLGLPSLQCIVREGDHERGFVVLNSVTRAFKGSDWMEIFSKRRGLSKEMSKSMQNKLRLLREYIDDDKLAALAKQHKFSPNVVRSVETLAQLFRHWHLPYDSRRLAVWVIENVSAIGIREVSLMHGRMQQRHVQKLHGIMKEGRPIKAKIIRMAVLSPLRNVPAQGTKAAKLLAFAKRKNCTLTTGELDRAYGATHAGSSITAVTRLIRAGLMRKTGPGLYRATEVA